MDKLERMYRQKIFFKTIYGDLMENSFLSTAIKGNKLQDGQHIRIFQSNEDYSKVEYFKNIDDLVDYTTKNNIFNTNTYFTLSTTSTAGGTKQDLKTRTVLGLDFDKKDLGEEFNHIDIINRFKAIGLWYHILTDSGHGYHAYICIEPTKDMSKVVQVTKAIGDKLGADINATKATQILRVPYTFNVKDKAAIKQVNTINIFSIDTIKRYDINKLYRRYCSYEKDGEKGTGGKITKFIVRKTNIPPCIEKTLLEGSQEGRRYDDLQKIVVTLRDRNKSLAEIKKLSREWANKSKYSDNLDYRVEHIYNNRNYVKMNCKGCKHFKKCYDRVESEFNYPEGFTVLEMTESHTRHLKASKRKGAKAMQGNEILVYGILKNHSDGLFRAEIEKELTYDGKTRLSNKTLSNALNNLEDNGFITVDRIGRKKFYKVKEIRSKVELTYNISYAATYEAVKGNISTEELRLYNYMRYLHNKQQREDPKALKGNLFYFNQRDLAKEIGVTQGRISQMINNLLNEKLLGIWYRQPSQNNGFDYYVYRLNY